MPQTFGTRSERRAFSRDAARHFATTRLRPTGPDAPARKDSPTRAERRKNGHRGDISALVHGKHDTSWLYSGTPGASGQARINAKRNARAEYWRTVRIRVSTQIEPHFRDCLDLLGPGTRICGRTELPWLATDLDVHIPGAPPEAVSAEPVYRTKHVGDHSYETVLDHIEWHRADGSRIDTELAGAAR